MLHLHEHATVLDLLIRKYLIDGVDRGNRYTQCLKGLDPMSNRASS
jgi:hypothetical protein